MRWRPSLVVRFGKGGSLTSPTSTLAHVFVGVLASAMFFALVAIAVTRTPLVLVASVLPALFLRDTWAWLAATSEERRAFREQVTRLQGLGHGPPPDRRTFGVGWGPWVILALIVWLVGSVALVARGSSLFLLSAMYALAFTTVVTVDRLRGWARARRARLDGGGD